MDFFRLFFDFFLSVGMLDLDLSDLPLFFLSDTHPLWDCCVHFNLYANYDSVLSTGLPDVISMYLFQAIGNILCRISTNSSSCVYPLLCG